MENRGLVLSGGGKRGVYQLAHVRASGKSYSHINGVSTGSLAGIMIASDKIDQAIDVYTEMSNNKIYSHSPLRRNGKIKIRNIIWRILRKNTSLGEIYKLRELILYNYTANDHKRVKDKGVEVTVYAQCIQDKRFPQVGFSNMDTDYETFVDAVLASCCFWPMGHIAKIKGKDGKVLEYVDGGHAESITIRQMMQKGLKDIDVYILQEKQKQGYFPDVKSFFDAGGRVMRGMREYSYWDNLEAACELAAQKPGLTINCMYLPKELSDNAMDFKAEDAREYERMGSDLNLVKQHTYSY